ncbi:MAG: S8 family serine peptidase [candidate division Zixibacteria bacterium]|nr:S8 family serine peptidase [candidate division Zixibacteria bacterium]
MKHFKIILSQCLLFCLVAFLPIEAQYYYSGGGQIPIQIDSNKVTIKFYDSIPEETKQSVVMAQSCLLEQLEDDYLIDSFMAFSLYDYNGYFDYLDSLESIPEIERVEPYYLTEDSIPILMGLTFFVLFNEGVTENIIDSINAIYNVEISDCPEGRTNVYYLKVTDSTEYHILDLANIYYEMIQTVYAHPDFSVAIIPDGYTVYDYYNQYQWHTKKVIGFFNDSSVWDFAGLDTAIKVAVIDDGLGSHPDIESTRVQGKWNIIYDSDDVTPYQYDAHGMACAGIIAASHTTDSTLQNDKTTGIVSMNPNAIIIPLKLSGFPCNVYRGSYYAKAINYAYSVWHYREADVISCSWHADKEYDELSLEIERAKIHGRNGLGCPVIFSSGNTNSGAAGAVMYPARLEACLAVGAIDTNDYRFNYSHYDTTLDLVAPSGAVDPKGNTPCGDVWSLDQVSILGVNPTYINDCPSLEENDQWMYCKFGGTSAACPVVSGTASLILSKDPNLTADEVYDILRNSAVKDLDWGTLADTPHVEYGYGRVDAFRAILSISHGDVDNDDQIDMSDITALIDYLYISHTRPFPSVLLGDCNCDSTVDISDITYLINFLI